MKNVTGTVKSAPRFIDATRVQVTKVFAKKAMIYGTPEYKLWREIIADCPAATMVTKDIRKNPNKKTSTNRWIMGSMLTINQAMRENVKVKFKYQKYTLENRSQQVERRHGADYVLSPYKLIINDGNY